MNNRRNKSFPHLNTTHSPHGELKLPTPNIRESHLVFGWRKPKQWDLTLAQAELAYSHMKNRSIGKPPFEIVYTKLTP